jgi:hypothetical protein
MSNDWLAKYRVIVYAVLFVLVAGILLVIYHWAASLFNKLQEAAETGPGQYHFTVNGPSTQAPAPQIIYVPVAAEQKTVSTVGVEAKEKDDPTDFEYRMKTNYFVDINGKKYEVKPAVQEDTKLQNNKIVMTQESKLNLKVDVPQPVGSFGAGVNNHGELAVTADGRIWKNTNWWVYASRTEQAGGLKVTIYK